MDKLGEAGARVQPLFIAVDPQRDTVGDAAAIHEAAKAYRVCYAKVPLRGGNYAVDHSAFIYLMGADGRYLGFMPPGTDAEWITETIRDQLGNAH